MIPAVCLFLSQESITYQMTFATPAGVPRFLSSNNIKLTIYYIYIIIAKLLRLEVAMEAIPVAIALQSGEMASRLIDLVDSHPLLDFCGAARSLPDLLRLLHKYRPTVLLISPSILEDLEPAPGPEESRALNEPLSFLLSGPDMNWGERELDKALRQPLRYCGLINRDGHDGEDLFHQIKHKVDLYSTGNCPAVPPRNEATERRHANGLIAVSGARGGVGTTTISCALAAALSSSGRRVLLMDMDEELSQLLHLKPRGEGKTVLDLLPMAEEISWDLVRVSVHRHAAGFYLLPHGIQPGDRAGREELIPEQFLRNLLFLFDAVVLDFPRPLRRSFLSLLHYSPMLLLVSLPDTLSANCARVTASSLRRSGLDLRRLQLVVNRCGSYHALRPEELARAAGLDLLACLPEDDRSGMDFAELGEVPRGDSPLGRAAAEMAVSLGFEVMPARKSPGAFRLKTLRKRAGRDFSPKGRP